MYCNEVPTKFTQCVFDNDDKLAPKELDYLNKCLFFSSKLSLFVTCKSSLLDLRCR